MLTAALLAGCGHFGFGPSQRSCAGSQAAATFTAPVVSAHIEPPPLRRLRAHLARFASPATRVLREASTLGEDTSSPWALPTVDKDISQFHEGRAGSYAWVQTSETLYIFAPVPFESSSGDGGPPQVELEVTDEGRNIRFTVAGVDILRGQLASPVKFGTEIWMIEEAPDGREFAVVEVDKMDLGREWTSVLRPEVSFVSDYSHPRVELGKLDDAIVHATVEETLGHIQRKYRKLQEIPDGYLSANGDVVTVDIQGFELAPDGSRGAPLEIGSAEGMRFELGAAGGILPELQKQLLGVAKGETRDAQVTLGKRGGSMGGRRIICAATIRQIEKQVLPELSDQLARNLKREEQLVQAASPGGIPDEEVGLAETFTIADLKAEIEAEIRAAAADEESSSIKGQLEASLVSAAKVNCDWADLSSGGKTADDDGTSAGGFIEKGGERDGAALRRKEEFAAIVEAVAITEGLLSLIDADTVERESWDALGVPKKGETIAQVGNDPAREFQASKRRVIRRHQLDRVLEWLEDKVEVVYLEGAR